MGGVCCLIKNSSASAVRWSKTLETFGWCQNDAFYLRIIAPELFRIHWYVHHIPNMSGFWSLHYICTATSGTFHLHVIRRMPAFQRFSENNPGSNTTIGVLLQKDEEEVVVWRLLSLVAFLHGAAAAVVFPFCYHHNNIDNPVMV